MKQFLATVGFICAGTSIVGAFSMFGNGGAFDGIVFPICSMVSGVGFLYFGCKWIDANNL